jgi:hypothetical protein
LPVVSARSDPLVPGRPHGFAPFENTLAPLTAVNGAMFKKSVGVLSGDQAGETNGCNPVFED